MNCANYPRKVFPACAGMNPGSPFILMDESRQSAIPVQPAIFSSQPTWQARKYNCTVYRPTWSGRGSVLTGSARQIPFAQLRDQDRLTTLPPTIRALAAEYSISISHATAKTATKPSLARIVNVRSRSAGSKLAELGLRTASASLAAAWARSRNPSA